MASTQLIKILCAEDEEDIRAIAQIALEDIGGFKVRFCKNGKEVLSEIEKFKPDLLLLDVMMPEMDGPSTLKALRKKVDFEKIPAIFMTAKIQPSEIAEYRAMGVLDVITKPFDPMKLSESIAFVWDRYQKGKKE
ncbi:MAG: two-component response regulator [uncultured bacterium]|nr:MAG: two-component response regulator [uncultured bacterium]